MSKAMMGFLAEQFEHHSTLVLSDGRAFQVARHAIERKNDRLFLRSDASIEHVFPNRQFAVGFSVYVPEKVLAGLLS